MKLISKLLFVDLSMNINIYFKSDTESITFNIFKYKMK